jgi:hypothetical protein
MSWLRRIWMGNRTIHEVERFSNLDLILRGFNGALNKLSDSIGGGLRALALAISTPQDNSEEVKAQLAKLDASIDELQATVEANQPK